MMVSCPETTAAAVLGGIYVCACLAVSHRFTALECGLVVRQSHRSARCSFLPPVVKKKMLLLLLLVCSLLLLFFFRCFFTLHDDY